MIRGVQTSGVLSPRDGWKAHAPVRLAAAADEEEARQAMITQRMSECIRRMQERVQAMAATACAADRQQGPRTRLRG